MSDPHVCVTCGRPRATESSSALGSGSVPPSAWRDIETAPKDGTVILAWGRGGGPGAQPWVEKVAWWAIEVADWEGEDPPSDAVSCWTFDSDGVKANPEGWQPLPSPPSTREA